MTVSKYIQLHVEKKTHIEIQLWVSNNTDHLQVYSVPWWCPLSLPSFLAFHSVCCHPVKGGQNTISPFFYMCAHSLDSGSGHRGFEQSILTLCTNAQSFFNEWSYFQLKAHLILEDFILQRIPLRYGLIEGWHQKLQLFS